MKINYIPFNQVVGRFLKEFNITDTTYVDDIPQWVEDAVGIIEIPNYYQTRHSILKVVDSKALLPCDLDHLLGIWITDGFNKANDVRQLARLFIRNAPLIGHGVNSGGSSGNYGTIDVNHLHTSFVKGYVYVVYKGIPIDCDGFPLVPKDTKLIHALHYYFLYRMALSGFTHPVIDFKTAYQQWMNLYPSASNSVNALDIQDLQEFTEMWTNPILGDLHANNYIV